MWQPVTRSKKRKTSKKQKGQNSIHQQGIPKRARCHQPAWTNPSKFLSAALVPEELLPPGACMSLQAEAKIPLSGVDGLRPSARGEISTTEKTLGHLLGNPVLHVPCPWSIFHRISSAWNDLTWFFACVVYIPPALHTPSPHTQDSKLPTSRTRLLRPECLQVLLSCRLLHRSVRRVK